MCIHICKNCICECPSKIIHFRLCIMKHNSVHIAIVWLLNVFLYIMKIFNVLRQIKFYCSLNQWETCWMLTYFSRKMLLSIFAQLYIGKRLLWIRCLFKTKSYQFKNTFPGMYSWNVKIFRCCKKKKHIFKI